MQTAEDAQRIIDIGAPQERVLVGGNIKFDLQVPPITLQEQERLRSDFGFAPEQQVFIAGSTHKGEEEIVIAVFSAIRRRFPRPRLFWRHAIRSALMRLKPCCGSQALPMPAERLLSRSPGHESKRHTA